MRGHEVKGKQFLPNTWFVGVTPRRNPELVVAVLWQNGEFSYYPARIGAKVVSAYVEKQRRLAHNLAPVKAAPAGGDGGGVDRTGRRQTGRWYADAERSLPGEGWADCRAGETRDSQRGA